MNHVSITSSTIRSAGWEDGVLEVLFLGGGLYRYKDVPEQLAEEFMKSESKGKFLARYIKGKFVCERV